MSVRLVLVNLGIAVAYFVLGRLGLLLALPPGYATAIWPPAGLAAGACLIWGGRRTWPGIFIGSAITNSLISGHFAPDILAAVIALGSTAQALVGEKLLRRVDPDLGFDSSGCVARFSLMVVLTCLTATTVGNAGLLAAGAIARSQFLASFITWWAGDALGMQIFTPLTLLLLDRREVWRGRRVAVGAPLVLSFLLSGMVYGYVRTEEEDQLKSPLATEAERTLGPLQQISDRQVRNLDNLTAFFRSSDEVTPKEFVTFTAEMIQGRQGFRAVEWAPLVKSGDEADYGRMTERLLGQAVAIVSLPGMNDATAPIHVPVTYIEPLQGNTSVLGLDLYSEAARRKVIERAMQSDHAVMSSRISLQQDPDGPGGLLIIQALRGADRRVTGFCLGIFDLRQLIASFERDPQLQWRLTDLETGSSLLSRGSFAEVTADASVALDRSGLYYRSVIPIADRHWQVTFYKPSSSLVVTRFSSSLLILFFAFATCGALGNLALTTSGERRRIADEVRQKTAALSAEVEQRQLLAHDLRESEQRYRRALEVAQLGSWRFDPVERRIHFDHWSRVHHGVAEDSIDVEQLMDLLHPDDREPVARRMREHLDPSRNGPVVERFEVRIGSPEGHSRVLEITAQPELEQSDEGLKARAVTGTSRDVTERKEYEEALQLAREAAENAVRTRAEFVANMSHELRTPMNGILGMVALALGTRLNLQQREYLLLVQESAQSLLRLLNDILDFSKMDAGKLELAPVEFDVRDQFGSTLQRMAEAAHGKGLGLHLRIAEAVPRFLRGDQQRLMQVLINLVGNATKFTTRGEIVVSVNVGRSQDRRVELVVSVRDTGAGISPAAQQRIFEPFSQADSSITRRFGGTGLGLSICRQIVALFHGRLWLESEVGQGSTFHFSAWLGGVARTAAAESLDGGRLRGRSVLVVDDSATARGILEEKLRGWQMKPILCTDRERVADLAASVSGSGSEPSFFLVDIHAGGVFGGEELARRVRDGCGPSIRIIGLLTAVEPPDVAVRCHQAGIDATVHQPIRESELIEAMLPAMPVVEDAARALSPVAVQLPPPAAPLRILVAEDYPVNQKIVVALLESRGHEVTLAENGRQAVELFQQREFDLILMDVQMPEMDGLAATREIREREAGTGRHIRIVAVTASAHSGERERVLAAGMDDYLAKPFSLPGLVAVVEPDRIDRRRVDEEPAAVAAGSGGGSSQPCFNRAEALARCLNNPSLLERVVAVFKSTQGDIRSELRGAVQRDDREALEHWAHRLKGGAASLSAVPSAEAAAALESASHSADRAMIMALLARVEGEVDKLLIELDAF